MCNSEDDIVELHRSFYGRIFGYCVYRLFRKDLAEDATAEVFLQLVKDYDRLSGTDAVSIRNWLFGTASNVAAKYLRDAKHRREITDAVRRAVDAGPGRASGSDKLDWPLLYEAIGRLNMRDQNVVTLRCFEGLEPREIAQALNLPQVTVRVRLCRAIRRLRKDIGAACGEDQGETR